MRAILLAAVVLGLSALAFAPAAEAITMPLCVGGPGYCREVVCISTDNDLYACGGDYYPCAGFDGPDPVWLMVCLGSP